MDKFTVDLDKVLNDFEYSELTEQYVKSNNQYSSNKIKPGPVKHSINNVFHSLNEYLSSDVGGNFETVTLNQNDIDVPNASKNVNDDVRDSFTKEDINFEELQSKISNCSGTDSIQSELLVPVEGERVLGTESAETVRNVKIESNDRSPGVLDVKSSLLEDVNASEIGESAEEEASVKERIGEEPPVDNTQNLINVETTQEIIHIEHDEEEIPQINIEINDVDSTIKDVNIVQEVINSVEDNVIEETQITQSDAVNIQKDVEAVGFNDNIVIDDLELNKYLDELEDELCEGSDVNTVDNVVRPEVLMDKENIDVEAVEEKLDEKKRELEVDVENMGVKVTPDVVEVNCNEDGVYKTKMVVEREKVLPRPDSLPLNEQVEEIGKRDINLIGEPGSTPYNNSYSLNDLQKEPPKILKENDVDSSSSSPTFSDVSSDSGGSTTPSTETLNEDDDGQCRNSNEEHKNVSTNSVGALGDNINEGDAQSLSHDNVQGENNNNNSHSGGGDSVEEGEGHVDNSANEVQELENSELNNAQGRDVPVAASDSQSPQDSWLGKHAPLWIPDSEALNCMHCDMKFTVIKRRHHCRACGLVLCSKCCSSKYRLEYLDAEARVCSKCFEILNKDTNSSGSSELSPASGNSPYRQTNQPNPNNPMEYCSMVPPLQQVSGSSTSPPSVLVPVGVLKRKGSSKAKSNKSVMFCDGIRPGSDLTNLDSDFNYSEAKEDVAVASPKVDKPLKLNRNLPVMDSVSRSFIPAAENSLPPTVTFYKSDITYSECGNNWNVVEMLKNEVLTFALQKNLYVHLRIISMDCCISKQVWCFSTEGLINVGQDEIVILLEVVENEKTVPKDVFYHISNIYHDAVKGTTVKEFGISLHNTSNFLDSKNHAGFLYFRPTFQCLQQVIIPKEQYLIGILMHRWETPWAKIFPLRLILRLGAEYRYYPSPIISTRQRESVFVEIGHTIINLLADFRNFSYTLPQIRGLTIHMQEKNTTVTIPVNRYDQVMKSINNSSDHILAFGGNFSMKADSHLVCIQDIHGNTENSYSTHAINIHNKPRKVTGASFIVFNGALKSTSGLTAKSSIVEDGLMIQVPPENLVKLRDSLKNMKDYTIQCGCVNAASDETVNIVWGESDVNFNIGVISPIDNQPMSGVPSIRVHNGKDFVCNNGNRLIRWTEVFIIQSGEENSRSQDPVDISKISESISKASCQALVKYLDLLSSNNFHKIGIRATLHVENVSYSAGSNSLKLPPIYMKSLDNELIPVLHRIVSNNLGDNAIVLELIFRILNV